MKKKVFCLLGILILALVLIACGDIGDDSIDSSKNNVEVTNTPAESKKPTDEAQDIVTAPIAGSEDSETSGITDAPKTEATKTPAPTSAPKPQKREWAGEAPSLSDEWTAYYCNFEEPKAGDYIYVLKIKHYFEKPENKGKFEVIESTYEITDELNWEYVYFDDIRYALVSDEGGDALMYDYSDVASGVEEFARVEKIGFLFDGKTIRFGYYDRDQTTIIYKTYYLNKLEYKK